MSGVNLVLQLCPKILKTNQLAVFFKYQYIREELINILDFFLHQGKIELGTTFLVGFGQFHVACLIQSDCRVLWSSTPLERINWYFSFLQGSFKGHHLWLGVARCVSCPIKLHESLIINISERSQSISIFFHLALCCTTLVSWKVQKSIILFVKVCKYCTPRLGMLVSEWLLSFCLSFFIWLFPCIFY